MSNEFCPRCNALRNMKMISTVRVIADPNDEKKTTITNDFHCETCNSFVRSSFNEDGRVSAKLAERRRLSKKKP